MRKIIFVLLYGILWGVLPLRAQKLVPAKTQCNATSDAKACLWYVYSLWY